MQAAICAAQKKVEWLGNKLPLMMLLPQAPAEGGTAKRHLWGVLFGLPFQHSQHLLVKWQTAALFARLPC